MTENKQKKHPLTLNRSGHGIFWPIFLVGLFLDLWSKAAVFDWLSRTPHEVYTLVQNFLYFRIAQNPGAAFGIAHGQQTFLVSISAIALLVVLGIFLFGCPCTKLTYLSLGLFAAGISGNLYDRIFNDSLVRDFIDVIYWKGKHWPTFNIADAMLCLGVALVLISGFFSKDKPGQKPSDQQKSGS